MYTFLQLKDGYGHADARQDPYVHVVQLINLGALRSTPQHRTHHQRVRRLHTSIYTMLTVRSLLVPVVLPLALTLQVTPRAASSPHMSTQQQLGTEGFWDAMYLEQAGAVTPDNFSPNTFSWYCGFAELEPFWAELVPDKSSHIVVPGVGNDDTIARMYDAGWNRVTAFDFSAPAVERASLVFGSRSIELLQADARELPFADGTFGA